MSAGQIVAAVLALTVGGAAWYRRAKLTGELRVGAGIAVVVLIVLATGVLSSLPSLETIIRHVADALGKGTYALVGAMAFLETGAFVGFIAPGEFTVILGGVIAGEGTISIVPLIGIVWICAIAGDSLSFLIGHRVGRQFLLKHGPKIRITEERFEQVEDYFDRHGGKTIVIGRFIGFVRPLAPFIAGSSRMTYGRFLPYSVVGTGLWGTTLCLLGYIFWRSFDKVTKIAGKATLGLAVAAALIGAIVYVRRRLNRPEERARFNDFVERHAWTRSLRFLWQRLTPGDLGLEFTSTVAVAVGAAYAFIFYASELSNDKTRIFPLDNTAFDIAGRMRTDTLVSITKVLTNVGSLPVVLTLVIIGSIILIRRGRPLELFALAGAFALVVLATHLAKIGIERPRPDNPLIHARGYSYPSAHSSYSTTYVALAVIAARVLGGIVSRTALVLVGVAIAAFIGGTRIYLRAHYLSDVIGGYGLGLAIFAGCAAIALVVGFIRHNETSPQT
jgi:membrane protein DedA with SNARE-associated domain/membrane-associated phospholipid phosphatase